MSWVDEWVRAVEESEKVEGATREMLAAFLRGNRAVLEGIGRVTGEAFFRTLTERGRDAAWDMLAQELNAEQVLALLKSTRGEMAELVKMRRARGEAERAIVEGLADVALAVLVRALVAAL